MLKVSTHIRGSVQLKQQCFKGKDRRLGSSVSRIRPNVMIYRDLFRKEGRKKAKAAAHVYCKSHWNQQGGIEPTAGLRMLWVCAFNLDRL